MSYPTYIPAGGDLSNGVVVLALIGGREARDTYPEAASYQVLPNGTLIVGNDGGAAVALYPPGVWVHACTASLMEAVPVVVHVAGSRLDGESE